MKLEELFKRRDELEEQHPELKERPFPQVPEGNVEVFREHWMIREEIIKKVRQQYDK